MYGTHYYCIFVCSVHANIHVNVCLLCICVCSLIDVECSKDESFMVFILLSFVPVSMLAFSSASVSPI